LRTIALTIFDHLHEAVRKLAEEENISINQFITLALAEKISALMTENYLAERAKRGDRRKFDQAMAKSLTLSRKNTIDCSVSVLYIT
jgi:hypothetical protein